MSVPQPQRVITASTSSGQTQTIKLDDFLRMCKDAGLEHRAEQIVQQSQPQSILSAQGVTTIVQKTQAGPQLQRIITAAPTSATVQQHQQPQPQQQQQPQPKPAVQTIKMEDILNAYRQVGSGGQQQQGQQQQVLQQVVTTNPATGQQTQKLIVQMPISMANNNQASPIKFSPFKTTLDPQKQAAYNATKLHSYTVVPQSPVLSNSNRASSLVGSANNSPMSQKSSMLMSSPNQWGISVNKRDMDLMETNEYLESKRFRREKGGKGLRHFSMKVCEKVRQKQTTSYNEVADELVNEFSDPRTMSPSDQNYDQKNIRRRVYDALNVLMAMNIISKEKKEIKWIGLPTNSLQECQTLEVEKTRRHQRIQEKKNQLQELLLQQIAFKSIVERNRESQRSQGPPPPNSAIHLPYIIVNTSKKTVIDCSISNDKYEYLFNFDNTFEIHDDIEVLKRMGMAFGLEKGQCTPDDVQKAIRMVPKVFEPYIRDLASGCTGSAASLLSATARSGKNKAGRYSGLAQQSSSQSFSDGSSSHRAPSRQSSVGSFSDIAPSRANTDTSDLLSDDDDDEMSD